MCQNDILVVDVINKIPSHTLNIHWRGQSNHEAPFMDGSSMISQCPIPGYTTFQYKFRASAPGTHFYHAFADSDRSDGLFGALIVRQAEKIEPHHKLYDVDSKDHVILISEWSRDLSRDLLLEEEVPKALLINGKSPPEGKSSLASFTVRKGKRYRFRTAYTSGYMGCPITISVDNHKIKVIALDGNPITPYEASSATIGKGERMDFVLKTDQDVGAYYLRVKSQCNNNELNGLGIINYDGITKKEFSFKEKTKPDEETTRSFDTAFCDSQIGRVCLRDVKALVKMPSELREHDVSRKIYLEIDYKLGENIIKEKGNTSFFINLYIFSHY